MAYQDHTQFAHMTVGPNAAHGVNARLDGWRTSVAAVLELVLAVLRTDRMPQTAPPDELCRHPAGGWVARFLDDTDLIPRRAANGPVDTLSSRFATALTGPVSGMVRPEHVQVVRDEDVAP